MKNKPLNLLVKFFSSLSSRFIEGIVDIFMIWKKTEEECSKKNVLIVDDNENLVNLMKYRLVERGYHVVTASNGAVGVSRLKRMIPDLIILDINMPQKSGLEFFKEISSKHGKAQYPVLFLTERKDLEGVCRDIQADGFLPKPFEIEEFITEVERILNNDTGTEVLLIDCPTNENVQKIRDILARERYQVNVVDGFAELCAQPPEKKPQFILAEYMQKDISGDEMIKKLKENPIFGGVPLIIYSYSGFKQYKMRSFYAGATKYLDAPQSFDDFVTAIREIELEMEGDWSAAS